MRVSCQTVDEFIENLEEVPNILDGVIRISIVDTPEESKDPVKFNVYFHASTIVIGGDADFLLNVNFACGMDYRDSSNEALGTEYANDLKKELKQYAESRGWRVLPGVLDI